MDDALRTLTRKPDRGGGRALVDDVFDHALVATLSTVLGAEPWAVPVLVVRDGDRLLIHGSTGAGAFRHLAGGAPVCLSAYLLDGVVVAERQLDHSANYRSAVVRGTCRVLGDGELAAALDVVTDGLLPGRSAECPSHTAKELASTVVLELAITDENWVAKLRSGPPSDAATSSTWTGVVPLRSSRGRPISTSPRPIPPSVRRFVDADGTES